MSHFSIEINAHIAVLTFNNPPLQVLTPSSINELGKVLPKLEQDETVRVLIITGHDSDFFIRHFSVGELSDNTSGKGETWDRPMNVVLYELEHFSKPVIIALNGSAAGGGLELAMCGDIRIAKDGPFRFGLPEVSVGILPGAGGTQRLPALVGRHRAMEMMLRPRLITPSEALEYGLLEELVSADSRETVLERAQLIAAEIASRPPKAVAHIKALARLGGAPVTMEHLKEEARRFEDLMASPEAKALLKATAQQHKKVAKK